MDKEINIMALLLLTDIEWLHLYSICGHITDGCLPLCGTICVQSITNSLLFANRKKIKINVYQLPVVSYLY